MTELTDRLKECLRTLVKLQREGTIPEEFCVARPQGVPVIWTGVTFESRITVRALSPLALDALARAGYIFSIAHYERHTRYKEDTYEYEASRDCYIRPAGFRAVDTDFAPVDDILMRRPPVELASSLAAFRADFPDPSRLAFVMMQFGTSAAHDQVWAAIRHALDPQQFVALRADSKQYHDNLLMNILTYVYGCRFGIAVFERIESEAFNPNVALEVEYMMGLGKPVCYLKERTLRTLRTDLVGQLYREFDLQTCEETIPPTLLKWMSDKGLMAQLCGERQCCERRLSLGVTREV
jgi:hypothetical protein